MAKRAYGWIKVLDILLGSPKQYILVRASFRNFSMIVYTSLPVYWNSSTNRNWRQRQPTSGEVVVFLNRRRTHIKLLHWSMEALSYTTNVWNRVLLDHRSWKRWASPCWKRWKDRLSCVPTRHVQVYAVRTEGCALRRRSKSDYAPLWSKAGRSCTATGGNQRKDRYVRKRPNHKGRSKLPAHLPVEEVNMVFGAKW